MGGLRLRFSAAMSSLPSPLKSAAATACEVAVTEPPRRGDRRKR